MEQFRYRLRGEVDLAVAPTILHDLRTIVLVSDGDVLIDCAELTFIDSSGVNVLLEAQKILRPLGRQVLLTNLRGNPFRVFEMLGLTGLFCGDDSPAE